MSKQHTAKTGKKPTELSWKRQAIVDQLPDHKWNVSQAAIAVGYAKSYAERRLPAMLKEDVAFCDAVEAKRKEIERKEQPRRERCLQTFEKIIYNPDTSDRDVIAAVKEQAAICGWHSETIKHETTERQALLDETARREAARLAVLALDTRALPDVLHTRRHVQSTIINATAKQKSDVVEDIGQDDANGPE